MRMRTPRPRRRPVVPLRQRPTVQQLKNAKSRQRQKPTGTPARAMPTPARATKRKPTGTPQRLPSKPPTSAQRAAMRKQAIAVEGNVAERRKRQDETIRKLERQGKISPGQRRSLKLARRRATTSKLSSKVDILFKCSLFICFLPSF